jgi:predicted phage terminase large subunit-like protein
MEPKPEPIKIGPQEGPQTEFLSTLADIAIYGGAAGGGKSYGLLLEPLRHLQNSRFGGVIFRREKVQVRNEGGLWDQSLALFTPLRAKPREAYLEWDFPSGMRLKFSHLENETSVYNWQGAEVPYLGFDELTHFTEKQFFYMLSRNRSTSGVPGYVRATCNPDVESWVRKLVDWYIGDDGFPIKERAGVIRYFIRQDDAFIWGDSREELTEKFGTDQQPKSFTFIPSRIHDNKILMEKDPSYLSNLMALSRVERMRLLGGNWNVRATSGDYFQREWFPIIDALPAGWVQVCRYWDKAATKPSEQNKDPDYTAGLKLFKYSDGTYVVGDVRRTRDGPLRVEQFVKNTALQDTHSVAIYVEQEPGSAGVADADNYVRLLAGFNVRVRKPTKDKVTRALPVSAQCERGNVKLLRGKWNDDFLTELENFGEDGVGHDDQVDTLSGAFNELCGNVSILDVL